MMALRISNQEVKILEINGDLIECLIYSTIDDNGEIVDGSIISLDKKWFCPARSPTLYKGKWIKLHFYPKLGKYGFPSGRLDDKDPYTLYSVIIQAVDSVVAKIMEQEILS